MPFHNKKRAAGFSLLEAIVAMVLISTLGASLFLWVNNSLTGLHRARQVDTKLNAESSLLEYASSINPMLSPQGQHDFGSFSAQWTATLLTPIHDAVNYPDGIGAYQIALYAISFQVKTASGEAWFQMTLKQPGFKKVRASVPFFGY